MIINDITFNTELSDVLSTLREELVSSGINLLERTKETPTDIMVSCPYHNGGQERKPSAGIRKTDGMFHCFACGETHSLQEVISHCFGHEDALGSFGWSWLLKTFVSVSVEDRPLVTFDISRGSKGSVDSKYVSEDELDSYRYTHPYMYKRKLTDEVIELFDIGYDTKTQCITFPVRDITGKTLFVARRSVNTKFFNYPSGAEKPVYGLYELNSLGENWSVTTTDGEEHTGVKYPDEIIICESMLDALTCWVYGKYAVALNGLGNDLQFSQLLRMPTRKFILATDMDKAGLQARDRIRYHLKDRMVTEYVWDVNVAKDINDMSKEFFDNLEEVF